MMWRFICLAVLIISANPAFAQHDTARPPVADTPVFIQDIILGDSPIVQPDTAWPLIDTPQLFKSDTISAELVIVQEDTVEPLVPAPLALISIINSRGLLFAQQDTVQLLPPAPLVTMSDIIFGESLFALHDTERTVTFQYPHYESDSLRQAFRKGTIRGNLRYYFMSTINDGALPDYFANAAGGSLSYETKPFHHISAGIGAGYAFNLGSSDLTKIDSATGQANRYEIGLFDIREPDNKNNMVRLEQLYLKYSFSKGFVQFGKLGDISHGFINGQDGRIRPTVEEGLWASFFFKHINLEGGWLYGISPRSTYEWFNVGKSIGWNPQGVNQDGSKSAYRNNLESAGIGIVGVNYDIGRLSVNVTEQYAGNLFNTALILAKYSYKTGKLSDMRFSLGIIKQDAVNDGGNADPAKAYFPKAGKSWVFSGQALWQYRRNFTLSLNATRITADGRYLMPREWGRDPFFTFMPRERNEGLGDVSALMVKAGYYLSPDRLRMELSVGHYNLPEVTNASLNKYGLPSYDQLNLDLRYTFRRLFKGLDGMLLYVYKKNAGDLHNNARYEINKVNMSQISLMLNFTF